MRLLISNRFAPSLIVVLLVFISTFLLPQRRAFADDAVTLPVGKAFISPSAGMDQRRYYGHMTVEDRNGVIAPWHKSGNGLCDERVRIAAETLRRYPWIQPPRSETCVPEYLLTDVTQAHIAPCVSGIVGKHSGVLFGRVAPSSQNGSDGCASAPAPS